MLYLPCAERSVSRKLSGGSDGAWLLTRVPEDVLADFALVFLALALPVGFLLGAGSDRGLGDISANARFDRVEGGIQSNPAIAER